MKRRLLLKISGLIFLFLQLHSQSFGLEKETHKYLNQYIAQNSINNFSLDQYLKNQLGIKTGVLTPLKSDEDSKRIWDWVCMGGQYEDEPGYSRSCNHFHDPLKEPWTDAGLSVAGFSPFKSSVIWAQDQGTIGSLFGGDWSWKKARDSFYKGLTGLNKADRDKNLADTFRALGQVMHLVQDSSVPAHVRNDIHIYFSLPLGIKVGIYHYEVWVDKHRGSLNLNPSQNDIFDPSILGIFYESSAPIPIANIFDTNKYDGSNPNIATGRSIGLAEYTNANFFSEDTIFKNYPHPAYDDTSYPNIDWKHPEIADAEDGKLDNRIYIRKTAGEPVQRLASLSYISFDCIKKGYYQFSPIVLDEKVYEDYASKLIPRAVGYSAGLLQYFFRGKLQVTSLPILYKNSIYIMRVKIKNITPTQETMKNGWFTLSYHYTPTGKPSDGSEDIFGQTSVCSSEQPCKELKFQEEMTIDFILPEFIPKENYNSAKFTLAIRGTLGNEEGAVIGKYFTPGEIKFNEEWDNGLNGNHTWAHLDFDTSQAYPGHGQTSNTIEGDTLIKENIRYAGYKNPSANGSFVGIDPVYSGFKDILPILITPNTYLEFKIDKMSINQIPPSPLGTTAHYQGLWLFFNHGLVLQLSQDDQFVYYNPTTTAMWTFDLGMIFVSNIYGMFQDTGITIPPGDLHLEKIKFIQQLFELGEPSTVEHHQHMEVDFIRIIEEKQQEEQQQ